MPRGDYAASMTFDALWTPGPSATAQTSSSRHHTMSTALPNLSSIHAHPLDPTPLSPSPSSHHGSLSPRRMRAHSALGGRPDFSHPTSAPPLALTHHHQSLLVSPRVRGRARASTVRPRRLPDTASPARLFKPPPRPPEQLILLTTFLEASLSSQIVAGVPPRPPLPPWPPRFSAQIRANRSSPLPPFRTKRLPWPWWISPALLLLLRCPVAPCPKMDEAAVHCSQRLALPQAPRRPCPTWTGPPRHPECAGRQGMSNGGPCHRQSSPEPAPAPAERGQKVKDGDALPRLPCGPRSPTRQPLH